MFERFTERARQVVVLGQDEARALKHNYIGTEHILLGLLREQEGIAARALESLGITIEEARGRVKDVVGEGDEPAPGQIPFTPRAKRVLELALREALDLGHEHIDTEHILLGLVSENGGVAVRILLDFGVDAEQVRRETVRMLSRPGSSAPRPERARTGPRTTPRLVPPRWEYKLEGVGGLSEEWLNALGAEGWELTVIVPPDRLVFKRHRHG